MAWALALLVAAAAAAIGAAIAPARAGERGVSAALDGALNVDAGVRDDANEYQCTVDWSAANPGNLRDLRRGGGGGGGGAAPRRGVARDTAAMLAAGGGGAALYYYYERGDGAAGGGGDAADACNVRAVRFVGDASARDAGAGVHDALPDAATFADAAAALPAALGVDELGAHAVCATAKDSVSIVKAGCRTLTWAGGAKLCVDFVRPLDALYVKLGSLGKFGSVSAHDDVPQLDAQLGGGDAPSSADVLRFAAAVDAELRTSVRFEAFARDAGAGGGGGGGGGDDDAPHRLVGAHTESTTRVVETFQVSTAGDGVTFDRLCIANANERSADGFCIIELDQRCPADYRCAPPTDSNPPPTAKPPPPPFFLMHPEDICEQSEPGDDCGPRCGTCSDTGICVDGTSMMDLMTVGQPCEIGLAQLSGRCREGECIENAQTCAGQPDGTRCRSSCAFQCVSQVCTNVFLDEARRQDFNGVFCYPAQTVRGIGFCVDGFCRPPPAGN